MEGQTFTVWNVDAVEVNSPRNTFVSSKGGVVSLAPGTVDFPREGLTHITWFTWEVSRGACCDWINNLVITLGNDSDGGTVGP